MSKGFGIVKEQTATPEKPFDLEMATKLYNALRQVKLLVKTPNMNKWADEFRKLRGYSTEQEISTTLSWYVKHLKDEFVPTALSASRFRSEYPRIVRAMQKHGGSLKPIDIHAETHRLHKMIYAKQPLSWPGTEGKLELQFIQETYESYTAIYNAVNELLKSFIATAKAAQAKHPGQRDTRDWNDTNRLLFVKQHMMFPHDFTIYWVTEVNKTAWDWPGWNGNLLAWVPKWDTPKVQQMLNRIHAEYSVNDKAWDRIKSLIASLLGVSNGG